jgi:glycosyltransferase involved in cell wall biosynthesis
MNVVSSPVKVVMVGPFWFPRGAASAARIRNLALGLQARGARVHVITMVPRPAVDGERTRQGFGEYQGVTYESVAPTTAAVSGWRDEQQTVPRLRGRFGDRVAWFAGLYGATLRARRRLRQRIESGECDLVFVYDRSAVRMTPLLRLCRKRRVPCVLDVTETSEHLGSRWSPLYWDFALGTRFSTRLFDGLTVITTGLAAFYRARGCATLVVPAVEEWRAAAPPPPTGNADFRLAYVGSLQPRDAPEALFETVRLVAGQGPGTTVELIGHYRGTERGRAFERRCAEDPVLSRAVRFLGTLSDEGLHARLAGADGILLTRRDARTEALSFPTRLVEHLRHGRPVFVSDVGDVSHYLQDGREVVLLDPHDPRRAAAAIVDVVRRPDRGASIGRGGREAGARAFDREVHAARLLDFAKALGAGGTA